MNLRRKFRPLWKPRHKAKAKPRQRVNKKRATPRPVHSERTEHITGHRRVRLTGKPRDKRRAEIFERAGGRCEEMVRVYHPAFLMAVGSVRCPNPATQWSHAKHAANKCDCLDPKCSIASCTDCHVKRHAGGNGKPCPKKEKVA